MAFWGQIEMHRPGLAAALDVSAASSLMTKIYNPGCRFFPFGSRNGLPEEIQEFTGGENQKTPADPGGKMFLVPGHNRPGLGGPGHFQEGLVVWIGETDRIGLGYQGDPDPPDFGEQGFHLVAGERKPGAP